MDITQEYLEMCGAAQEIQTIKYRDGFEGEDVVHIAFKKNFYIGIAKDAPLTCTVSNDRYRLTLFKTNWLPRQDELQRIILYRPYDQMTHPLVLLLRDFASFVGSVELVNGSESYEQYWLRYVMIRKYNKYWSKEQKAWLESGSGVS